MKAIASYIQRKIPTILQTPIKEEQLTKANVPKDALVALLLCLQQIAPSISNELKEPILAMIQNSQPLMAQMNNRSNIRPQSTPNVPPVGPVRPTPRPPPPTSMFPGPAVHDPLGGLAGQLGDRLNLGTAPVSSAANSSAFSALPGNSSSFRNMSPGSPNRLFGAPGAPVSAHTPDGGSSPSLFNLGR